MSKKEKSKKSKKGNKIFIAILILIILVAGGFLGFKIYIDFKDKVGEVVSNIIEKEEKQPEKKLQIIDEESKSRPYAVMINNNHAAWPLCGVQDAYLVYEIVAEGGITRMMALYKDQETAKIGSIRSARHYFIDYAEENDAIYVHWGGSDQAYARIKKGIEDIDGMAYEGTTFFRDKTLKRASEHTGFSSMEKLKERAEEKGYIRDTNKDLLLNYSIESIEMENKEEAQSANEVIIRYSDYHTTSYVYDEENKMYKRSMSGQDDVDLVTGKQCMVKNIITYSLSNYTLNDGSGKGRQELENIGTGEGYFISEGYAIPITWEKISHSGQTVYRYKDGTRLNVNDGNTFIQIYPKTTGKLTITPKVVPETVENVE